MEKIDIHGKKYIMVNERLIHFRNNYKDYSLVSEIVSIENGVCIFVAKIVNPDGVIRATGHAYEKEGSSFINKTSYIENAETSAWGRALANFGIGIDTSVASYEEVANAKQQQKPQKNINQNTKLSFGKHKGKAIKDVDNGYLEWLAETKQEFKNTVGKIMRKRSLKKLWDGFPEDIRKKVSKKPPETMEELENCLNIANEMNLNRTGKPTDIQVAQAKKYLKHDVIPEAEKLKIEKRLAKVETKKKYAEALIWLKDEIDTREAVEREE